MPESKWKTAFEQCKNYRDFLDEQSIPSLQKTKAYLLTRRQIEELLSQNGKDLDGIRIYIGKENYSTNSSAIRLYAVGAILTGDEQYNDFDIPNAANVYARTGGDEDTDPVLDEGMPCPITCSDDNGLNS